MLRSRKVTAVELAKHFLDRLERLGPTYNAVVTVLRDSGARGGAAAGRGAGVGEGSRARCTAFRTAPRTCSPPRARRRRGARSRIAIRCSRATRPSCGGCGRPARCCAPSSRWSSWPAGWDTTRRSPASPGPGRSPWDPARWSGGSSSGSGAAVGAGLVPFAIGSETWGSIQYPAAFCGVTGLRPTYGRVSRHGAMALSWTMDKLGPLARTAEDCGIVLAADRRPRSRGSVGAGPAASPSRTTPGSREAATGSASCKGTLEKTQPEVRRNFEESLRVLREFAEIEEDLDAAGLSLRGDGVHRDRRRGGERLRAALRERADHRAHRAGGPDRRLRGPGGAGEGLHPRAPAPPARRRGAGPAARAGGRGRRADPADSRLADRRGVRQGVPGLPGRCQYRRSGEPLRRARRSSS